MPFSRIPEISSLIATIDTAMARADDIGNDMIRDLMPDLRDAIDEINAALREVDALLFEGLRDEAVTLHDDDFATLASRLNLEDREGWPELERFFVVEGISPPPKLDYDTLSALESAHAELENLRRPLDRLRRLALERAPVFRRLALLRSLREADPTKPVWTQSINDHEEARLAELHEQARQVLNSRQPEAIAELHAELVDPEWGISLPKEFIRATRGADLWIQLRAAADQATLAVAGLEAGWSELQHALPSPELIDRLRQLRVQWDQAQQSIAECRQHLAGCPTVAGLIRQEKLDERIDALPARVSQPLDWLTAQDTAEAYAGQLQQVCGQLEYLCEQKPRVQAESAWLADMERLSAEVMRLCQTQPGLVYPVFLRERVAKAVEDVRGRAGQRTRFKLLTWAAAAVAVFLVLMAVAMWLKRGAEYRQAITQLETYRDQAEPGEFEKLPEQVKHLQERYPTDVRVSKLIAEIESSVDREWKRRDALREAFAECDTAMAESLRVLGDRPGADRVMAWPPEVVAGAQAWRRARKVGGLPGKRIPKADDDGSSKNDPVERLHKEEEEIASREVQQKKIEDDYERAAAAHVRERNREILGGMPTATDTAAGERLVDLLRQIDELLTMYPLEKTPSANELLEKTSRNRFTMQSENSLKTTRRLIEERMREDERENRRPAAPDASPLESLDPLTDTPAGDAPPVSEEKSA